MTLKNFFFKEDWVGSEVAGIKTAFFAIFIWSNGQVVKALDFQSGGPVLKTTGWLQGQLSLSILLRSIK